MNRLLFALWGVASLAAAETSPKTTIDANGLRCFHFYGGFFNVRASQEWKVVRASDDDVFPIVEFRFERAIVILQGYQFGRGSKQYYDNLNAALERTPNPDKWSWDKHHTWQVFRSRETEANASTEIREYYSMYRNSHSHTYGIHVTLRYPADIDDPGRKRLNEGLTILFSKISIENKM